MPQSLIQRAFSSGEIAASLFGRADLTKYAEGLKTCRNMVVLRHGGVSNRTGSQFLQEVKDSTVRTYFLKFVFNDEQTYVIEAGDQYFRFYRDGAPVLAGTVPYEIPTPYLAADLALLRTVQSGDVVTIVHPNYDPRELSRTGDTAWTLTVISFVPTLASPASPAATAGVAGAIDWRYQVTAVRSPSYEESLPTAVFLVAGGTPVLANPNTLAWSAVADAAEYNVYREVTPGNGVYGFIGVAQSNDFNDPGIQPDESLTPPIARDPFAGAGNRPSVVTYTQQRQVFANTLNNPQLVAMSRTANFHNFTISSPIQDDDAITLTLVGRQVNEVRHMVEIVRLILLTSGGVWVAEGDQDGVLRPTAINIKQHGQHGAAEVPPVVVGNNLIYVQARGSIIRDLRFNLEADGYAGKDLTLFSPHLFSGYRIERMDYAEIPQSLVWCVRSDGTLLGLTYLPEQDVWGWHRHDTDGVYEDVCAVPEGDEDAVYVIVKRTIGGVAKRYVERFASRRVTDVALNAFFLDSYLSYDGGNTTSTTVQVQKANPFDVNGWKVGHAIKVVASTPVWTAGNVGDVIVVRVGADVLRVTIDTFITTLVIQGLPDHDVPVSMQGTTDPTLGFQPTLTLDWERAVDEVGNLDHLEGKTVSILGDGNVFPQQVVSGGRVAIDRPSTRIRVGLPYDSDFETVDLDAAQAQIRDKKKRITSVSLLVESSRGVWIGPDVDHLREVQPVVPAVYGDALATVTGLIEQNITTSWSEGGRVFVRQSDPLPLTILAAIPCGDIGG